MDWGNKGISYLIFQEENYILFTFIQVAEFAPPMELLANENSMFASMVLSAGSKAAMKWLISINNEELHVGVVFGCVW